MSNLQRLLAGRKKESAVWKYYSPIVNGNIKQSRCLVVVNGKQCGEIFRGTNPSNLKKHLKRFHDEAAADVDKRDLDNKNNKWKAAETASTSRGPGTSGQNLRSQTITDCVRNRRSLWARDSNEYNTKLDALAEVFISTGYPMTLLDDSAFRSLLTTLDPKFCPPGWYSIITIIYYYIM